jgi:hypothetical protein
MYVFIVCVFIYLQYRVCVFFITAVPITKLFAGGDIDEPEAREACV